MLISGDLSSRLKLFHARPMITADKYNLSEGEKEKIKCLVHILNNHSISLAGYHEMTQINSSLPRSYLAEGCQKSLDTNKIFVKSTHGPHAGVQVPFKLLPGTLI